MILFIKHIAIEGPETLREFFDTKRIATKTIELQSGDALPATLSGIDAVISLGGPMNVYEEEEHPFLKNENTFLKKVIKEKVPFLGICLGSQLLAKACEAQVGRSPEKEIGFFPVRLTQEGKKDPLFEGLKETVNVFQWHEDMSQIPLGAKLLVSSQGCPHQAFKVGPSAYGLQFHVEVTEPTIRSWAEAYFPQSDSFYAQQKRVLIDDYARKKKSFHQTADAIYNNFLRIIHQNNVAA